MVHKQSPPILWPWVSIPIRDMTGTPPEARKCWKTFIYSVLKRLARADHPKTQYLPFLASKFWRSPQQLAKNAEKCAIDSFCKAEDDPTKTGQFPQVVQQIYDL